MAFDLRVLPSTDFRRKLLERGGASVARCYQCATCSAVCELARGGPPFPRRQMMLAQWGLEERLAADPALWLCYQCNDCTERCPRDARPGDVMGVLRGLAVETLATPRILAQWVGNAAKTWPLLLGVPILFWVALLYLAHGLRIPEPPLVYHEFVPHVLIYVVYTAVSVWVIASFWVSGRRFWGLAGESAQRRGAFLSHLWPVLVEIATHRRFGSCGPAKPRRWGHLALLWGFVAAAVASGIIIVAMYVFKQELPLPQLHPAKIIGNLGAVLLVIGGSWLLYNRLESQDQVGQTNAFDSFFLFVVLLVVTTGVLTELGRLFFEPALACTIYVVHLGSVLCLFLAAPYCKFAHFVYRTLAMVHERMAAPEAGQQTGPGPAQAEAAE
jgi:quinone-modifying oxidoreductase subunit QmoC